MNGAKHPLEWFGKAVLPISQPAWRWMATLGLAALLNGIRRWGPHVREFLLIEASPSPVSSLALPVALSSFFTTHIDVEGDEHRRVPVIGFVNEF